MRSANVIGKPILCVFMALVIAFAPFNVKLEKGLSIEQSEAHAIAPVFAGAGAFLTEMATAAGFASAGEFVATIVGVTAVGTGMSLASSEGVRYGTEASQNLNNLIDAADYPAWDTLSSTEQNNWGSKDNYESAKFNSLMAAYGLGDAYGRYQSAWGSGGAGNFSFTSQEQSSLEQIGDIGENWASGLGNSIQDINNLIISKTAIYSYAGETESVSTENTGLNLPAGLNSSIYGVVTNGGNIKAGSKTIYFISDNDVIYTWMRKGSTGPMILTCSKNSYRFAANTNSQPPTSYYFNATQGTVDGNSFYYVFSNWETSGAPSNATMPSLGTVNSIDTQQIKNLSYLLLYGNYVANITQIPNYPADMQQVPVNTVIYYPVVIESDTPWEDFLVEPEEPVQPEPIVDDLEGIAALIRKLDSDMNDAFDQFGFFSNGDLKVHDEGVFTELSDIYSLLMEISAKIVSNDIVDSPDIIGDFDFGDVEAKVPDLLEMISDLAPFGALALLSEIFAIVSEANVVDNPELVFPFQFGGYSEEGLELVLDLSWLDDIKPAINFFSILMLVLGLTYATIRVVQMEAAP